MDPDAWQLIDEKESFTKPRQGPGLTILANLTGQRALGNIPIPKLPNPNSTGVLGR